MPLTRVASTKMKVAMRPKLREKYVKQQLVQTATLDATWSLNNITKPPARGGVWFNLPADEINRQISAGKNKTTLKWMGKSNNRTMEKDQRQQQTVIAKVAMEKVKQATWTSAVSRGNTEQKEKLQQWIETDEANVQKDNEYQ